MNRRTFVGLAGVVGVGLLAGCSGGETGPADVVEQNFRAFVAGNAESFRQTVHTESPMRENWNQDYWEEFGASEPSEWTVETVEVLDRSETEATVRLVYTWDKSDGDTVRYTNEIDLRTESGDWKLFEIELTDRIDLGESE